MFFAYRNLKIETQKFLKLTTVYKRAKAGLFYRVWRCFGWGKIFGFLSVLEPRVYVCGGGFHFLTAISMIWLVKVRKYLAACSAQ